MVIMGRVASAFGVRGWVKVQPFSEYVDGLLDYGTWHLGHEKRPWRKAEVLDAEAHDKTLAVHFSECPDRNAAEKLKGLLIAVPRSSLPEQDEDEYYWADLIGLAVVNVAGEALCHVAEMLETGANDVLVVRGTAGELLIPFLKSVILNVDMAAKTIEVDWSTDYLL